MTISSLAGWIELDGKRLDPDAIETILRTSPEQVLHFGGEFFLTWNGCSARDHFGIMEGTGQKGMLVCNGEMKGEINPSPMEMSLEEAIVTAVKLRSDEGIVALSGGVDSALVAYLAQRECVAVGIEGSHDLKQARHAAETLGLPCTYVTITEDEIASALPEVVAAIPKKDPVNTGIALTLYFIARWAGEHGYRRIITGQGADELFGGYTRYLETTTLEADLERDFAGLEGQARRDQAVAGLHGAYLSMPYLDVRVVRAAHAIPAMEKVKDGRRKIPLRTVAERYIPRDLAGYEKKAMQYGSGIWTTLRKLARKNGYKTSMQDYIDYISRVENGH
ncbi:MAG: asparagine synthase C-terminal domain-containing protein [Methanoregula sp.]|nr:asparagine synthase C-terminal domain-containing protein [Methanoregula sp.]